MVVTFDGACEPRNPGGHIGLGWTVNGVAAWEYIPASPENTNNRAEYLALLRALEIVLDKVFDEGIDTLVIEGDSQLVIGQLTGEYSVGSPSIKEPYKEVQDKLASIRFWQGQVTILCHWIPREENTAADMASRQALAEHGIKPRTNWKQNKPHLTADCL